MKLKVCGLSRPIEVETCVSDKVDYCGFILNFPKSHRFITFDKAKELMIEMSKNYLDLLELFPENSKEGFKTESLPIIWEDRENFNLLMQKSSDDMIKLTSVIETTDNIRGTIGKLMWSNCKACHSKYRKPH